MTDAHLSRDGKHLTVRLPLTFHKSGHRKRVIIPIGAASWQPVPLNPKSALLNAIGRAHRWKQMMENGEFESLKELAKAEKINFSYVCRILRLVLLSPKIIEAILDGRQDPELELRHLLKPLPFSWDHQHKIIPTRQSNPTCFSAAPVEPRRPTAGAEGANRLAIKTRSRERVGRQTQEVGSH